jgi:hypothetical protein
VTGHAASPYYPDLIGPLVGSLELKEGSSTE